MDDNNNPLKDLPSGLSQDDINDFCHAANMGDMPKLLKYLDTHGHAIINERDMIDARAITWAAFSGHLDIVKLLVERGADINAGGTDDRTALNFSAGTANEEIVSYLLSKGASVEQKDKFERTPIDIARQFENTRIVELIEKHIETQRRLQQEEEDRNHRAREAAIKQLVETRVDRIRKINVPKLK